jgi:hypothetical protein
MAVDCTPNGLAEAAKCFTCLPSATQTEVQTYLLAVIAGGSLDPNTLIEQAKAFQGIGQSALLEVQTYLLCQIVNA